MHQEAHRIWLRLSARNPVRFEPGRARSLTNLGMAHASLSRVEQSVRAHDEAITVYRNLAYQNPSRREQNLAWSLGSFAASLASRGLDEAAQERFAEALTLFRRRYEAGTRSVLFVTGYRSAVDGYAALLALAGRHDEVQELRTDSERLDRFLADL
jgi:tetratricopeptide (TPR) repeat protein